MTAGYAETSMDGIAAAASVSVKTIYSYFKNKDELYRAVMTAACDQSYSFEDVNDSAVLLQIYPWFGDSSLDGLIEAGKTYLDHLLSPNQIALYRLVAREVDRLPDVGRLYQTSIAKGRSAILATYLSHAARANGWDLPSPYSAAQTYEALLRGSLFEEVLHGLRTADTSAIEKQALEAAVMLTRLLEL